MTLIAEPRKTRLSRIPLWDNSRFLCVTLVVIGHGVQRLTLDSNNALTVYLVIYAFHMPAFAIISGYFSKASPPTATRMKKILTDILLPYLIMEAIWSFVKFLYDGSSSFNPSQPSWTLWFLLALGIFRLVLPYLALFRWPLLLSIALSVSVGYLGNVDSTFSLIRTIGLLPFFVLGWKARQWDLARWWMSLDARIWWFRFAALAIFAAWLAVVGEFIVTWRSLSLEDWFYYDDSYHSLAPGAWWAGFARLAVLGLGLMLSAAFFSLVPRRRNWMTRFGQATMYVYLLHSFLLYPVRESGFLRGPHSSASWLVFTVIACFAISIVLASPFVRRIARPLIEPKPRWLFHSPSLPRVSNRVDPDESDSYSRMTGRGSARSARIEGDPSCPMQQPTGSSRPSKSTRAPSPTP